MERIALKSLLEWKNKRIRKPLLVDGARQVGKTYLIEEVFGKKHFRQVLKLDFLEQPALKNLFQDTLSPQILLTSIQLALEVEYDPITDLLFFDEIAECPKAVTALKYFSEKMPDIYLCASGSNIGLLNSFPVGKVESLELFPMSFEEFLMASHRDQIIKMYQDMSRLEVAHQKIWQIMLDYYFVGGMPEAVREWYSNSEKNIITRCSIVKHVHKDLIDGYLRDFGKYSGRTNAQHIERVFENIPTQLAANLDASVNRYRFTNIISKKTGYKDLSGPIDWLEKTKLAYKNYPISSEPTIPLAVLKKDNIFKLFMFDVGLLGYMLNLSYQSQTQQNFCYKGFIAENFVHNELVVKGLYPTYSWNMRDAEIEFIVELPNNSILPIEVKSSSRTRAKSLKSYVERYQPESTMKLIGSVGSSKESGALVWPLYYASKIETMLSES